MPTGAGARTARTAGGDYSVTTQGVTAPVWNHKGAPRGTRSLVFSRRLAPIRHPARNTSTHSWAHARIPLDAPRGGPGRRAARPGEAHSRADPIGRPARTPSTRFMYSHTRGTAVITAQSPASRQQAHSKHHSSARGASIANVWHGHGMAAEQQLAMIEQLLCQAGSIWGPTRGGLRILFRLGCSYLFTASQRCNESMKPLEQSA